MVLKGCKIIYKEYACFVFLAFFLLNGIIANAQKESYKLETVVIDAGHGGKDNGAHRHYVNEKNITLSISLQVGRAIKKKYPHIKVIYTRDRDEFIPLYKRAEIANMHKADLFISIHANSFVNRRTKGTETYVLGLHRSEDNLRVAMRENSVMFYEKNYTVRYKGFDPTKPESYIIFNLIQNLHLDNSLQFAQLVEDEFYQYAQRHSRGVKQAGFLVLREVSMPSVLIETGFISNRNERAYLTTARGQTKLATAIFRAFNQYKASVEKEINIIDVDTVNVYYAVQILSLQRSIKFSEENKKKLPNFKEHYINNSYKYTVGRTKDKHEIDMLQQKFSAIYKNCFVVAFHNDKRVSIRKAKKLIKAERNE